MISLCFEAHIDGQDHHTRNSIKCVYKLRWRGVTKQYHLTGWCSNFSTDPISTRLILALIFLFVIRFLVSSASIK